MGRRARFLTLSVGAAIIATVAVSAATGARQATPGITATSVKIGGTFPLTGVAALYKTIPAAENAYYSYVNDHGGVNGRKINFEILDDGYDPSKTVPLVQKMVEQDNVFAVVGSLGTAPGLATWGYLNSHKVPQILLATGDSYWGFCARKKCGGQAYPWTIGWQPDYPGESKLYGQYIAKNLPNAKVGVLYQNDSYGKNYYAGLRIGLAEKKSEIVSAQTYDPTQTNVSQQIVALKAAGANVLVVFALPTQTIGALVTTTKVGWKPDATIINNVSANPVFLKLAAANGADTNGVISTNYVNYVTTVNSSTAGAKLAKAIIAQYAPALDLNDSNVVYGLGVAWTFTYALQHAGKNPTRASLMKALHNLNVADPFAYPGMRLKTSATDNFPYEQLIFQKWNGSATGQWAPFGKIYDHLR
ncbi:MAG TPA: ABC transporter substrate-binding protein [Gaiellaceae bacterium]|jgi:branched-chain amino acid transport system substrate-binding protein